MATLSDDLTAPSSIAWDTDGKQLDAYGMTSTAGTISADRTQLFLNWVSNHSSFQVRWRVRSRYTSATESRWTDWGAWQGIVDDDSNAASATTNAYGVTHVLNAPFEHAYTWPTYDFYEYEVMVRTLEGELCSQWATAILKVRFAPSWGFVKCQYTDEGINVLFDCDNVRPIRASVKSIATEGGKVLYSGNAAMEIPAKDGYVFIEGIVSDESSLVLSGTVATADGASSMISGQTVAASREGQSTTPSNAYLDFEDTELGTEVLVWCKSLHDCTIRAEWTGVDGEANSVTVDSPDVMYPDDVVNGYRLIAQDVLFAAPIGVPVRYFATVTNGPEWSRCIGEHEAAQDGLIVLVQSDGTESTVLRYDSSVSGSYTPEVGVSKLAGRRKPISRFGVGGVRKLTAKGTLLKPAGIGSIERLKGRTWLYRDPLGNRMKVLVTSVSYSANRLGIIDASISMTEVE